MPTANVLLDAHLAHRYPQIVAELASRLVSIPLVVRPLADGVYSVTLYDSAEQPTVREGVERDTAESLQTAIVNYWS